MLEWWGSLTVENQVFFAIAAFFSVLFIWQFIMTLIGMASGGAEAELEAGGAEADLGEIEAGAAAAEMEAEAGDLGPAVGGHETAMSFRLLSFRSIITAGLMFGWAGALYLYNGVPLEWALIYSILWAFGGALVMSILLYLMRRMQETGTRRIATCVGQRGTVYMDIPAGGTGKVRTVVSGAMSFVGARGAGGGALEAGTAVRVRRVLDPSTVEVERVADQ